MLRHAFAVVIGLTTVGCSIDLPEIAAHHPGSAAGASGVTYSTPQVLGVRPIERPAHQPMTQPRTSHGNDAAHGGHGSDSKGQLEMQREGQRHGH